jgi:hypothetical protein
MKKISSYFSSPVPPPQKKHLHHHQTNWMMFLKLVTLKTLLYITKVDAVVTGW